MDPELVSPHESPVDGVVPVEVRRDDTVALARSASPVELAGSFVEHQDRVGVSPRADQVVVSVAVEVRDREVAQVGPPQRLVGELAVGLVPQEGEPFALSNDGEVDSPVAIEVGRHKPQRWILNAERGESRREPARIVPQDRHSAGGLRRDGDFGVSVTIEVGRRHAGRPRGQLEPADVLEQESAEPAPQDEAPVIAARRDEILAAVVVEIRDRECHRIRHRDLARDRERAVAVVREQDDAFEVGHGRGQVEVAVAIGIECDEPDRRRVEKDRLVGRKRRPPHRHLVGVVDTVSVTIVGRHGRGEKEAEDNNPRHAHGASPQRPAGCGPFSEAGAASATDRRLGDRETAPRLPTTERTVPPTGAGKRPSLQYWTGSRSG